MNIKENSIKLLIIGQPDSPHNVGFIDGIRRNYKEIIINFFPSSPFNMHTGISSNVDFCYSNDYQGKVPYQFYWAHMFSNPLSAYSGDPEKLSKAIEEFRPDYIQINCIQDAGYLLDVALSRDISWASFKVILSIWGNDIIFFQGHPGHKEKIKSLLARVDVIIPESSREISLARSIGYTGKYTTLVEATLVTEEKLLSLFGVENKKDDLFIIKSSLQSNRSSLGGLFYAIKKNIALFYGYTLVVIDPSLEDYKNLQSIEELGVINIKITGALSHVDFCALLNRARFGASINLSDGVPNFFLECCAAMCWPILSTYSSLEDWNDGANISIIDPYDKESSSRILAELMNKSETERKYILEHNRGMLSRYSLRKVDEIIGTFYN